MGAATVSLLSASVRTGDHVAAVATFPEAVRHWQRSGMWVQQWTTLRLLAELLADLGVDAPAVLLLAAADADRDAPVLAGTDAMRTDALLATLTDRLGAAELARLRAQGRELGRSGVVELALDIALPAAVAAVAARRSDGTSAGDSVV